MFISNMKFRNCDMPHFVLNFTSQNKVEGNIIITVMTTNMITILKVLMILIIKRCSDYACMHFVGFYIGACLHFISKQGIVRIIEFLDIFAMTTNKFMCTVIFYRQSFVKKLVLLAFIDVKG